MSFFHDKNEFKDFFCKSPCKDLEENSTISGSIWVGDSAPGRNEGTLNFGGFRSKSSNFEVQKIWGMNVEMAPYLRKYKY